jgi:hypothetical protein
MSVRDEQRETARLREATLAQWREHPKAELHVEVDVSLVSGRSEKRIELHALDGYVLLDSHGEVRLDRDAVITLRKQLDQAFQVVA